MINKILKWSNIQNLKSKFNKWNFRNWSADYTQWEFEQLPIQLTVLK